MKNSDLKYMSATAFSDMKRGEVYWQPNRFCNYACSYCWPSSHTNKKDFVDKDLAYRTIDRVIPLMKKRGIESINWGWSGGEATFHPNFLDFQERILSYTPDMGATFNITTNLSHNMPWWEEFIRRTEKYDFRVITSSLHQEYVDTPAKVEKFIDKLDYLKDAGCRVTINQVMDPDIYDDQIKVLERFYERDHHVSRKINSRLHRDYIKYTGETVYEEEQIEDMNNSHIRKTGRGPLITVLDKDDNKIPIRHFEEIKNNQLWALQDWVCSVGYISVCIEGEIIKRGVGGCHKQVIGKMTDDWELYDEPKLCGSTSYCSCVADLKLPKWNPKYVAESEWKKT
jgi:sulfatase maturation enzyme AslB (radical SAM superfamily)|tara:strand:- start:1992 stop:3014 length:1023 start_codon:yes stop_codon:yes gene_type:complete